MSGTARKYDDRSIAMRGVTVFSAQGPRPGSENQVLVQEDKGIFVIADGFGGPNPGSEAAKTACEAVRGFLFREAGDQDATLPFEIRPYFSLAGNVLFNSLIHANRKVHQLNKGKSVHERGGSSVLAGYLDEGLLALANVGNCTAWLGRQGSAVQLAVPRSYGKLVNPFAADVPVDQRVPMMALGITPDMEPEVVEYRLEAGDWIVLHTEGMPSRLREDVFALQGMASPEDASQRVRGLLGRESFDSDFAFSLIIL